MHTIEQNINLKKYTTMGLPAFARYFTTVDSLESLQQAVAYAKKLKLRIIVLGEGSNSLFIADQDALVIRIRLTGKTIIKQQQRVTLLYAAAGENWDSFVEYTINLQLYGLENLSLIPGTVGAAPVQNIGAYGVELDQFIEWVEVLDLNDLQIKKMTAADCHFKYRDSIFKNDLKDQVIIVGVAFRLYNQNQYNLSYAALKDKLLREHQTIHSDHLTSVDVRNAVIAIRSSKLPDPAVLPNAGSFFKNPVIKQDHYLRLKQKFEELPCYRIDQHCCKIPAAWLIDRAGWKGKHHKGVAVHTQQALVLVNQRAASGEELLQLAQTIQRDIADKYDVYLEIEPQIYT